MIVAVQLRELSAKKQLEKGAHLVTTKLKR